MQVPLFPLNTVLFPGGPLPLRIFEARYVDMISHCLKENASFGVLLIREGQEAGTPASTFEVGTLARIVDWYQGSDGLLGVTAIGTLAEILEAILDDLGRLYEGQERHFDDAGWVANRFIEILPIALDQKQLCLESANQQQRLQLVSEVLKKVRFPGASGG